jgi:SRSO17 transposase
VTSARFVDDYRRVILEELFERVAPRFVRREPRLRAQLFVRGILSGLARKNSWTLARYAGESDPNGMQRLLTSAQWDVDGVRDDLRDWVIERLDGPGYGVLIPVDASFPKRGNRSVGVHRRYSETLQRSENVQVGVFLVYATPRGWALVDRELYLPPSRTTDAGSGGRLGVPAGVGHVPEPELARRMIERVLDSGVDPPPWVTAGETFGRDPALARWLDRRGVSYGLATRATDPVAPGTAAGVATAPIGEGPDGERLLYRCRIPAGMPLRMLSEVTSVRYRVEERFPQVTSEMGLDQYQVRRYDAWYRHVTLCMLAGAYLAVVGDVDG